jgi:hypothetical protein
VTKYTLYDVLFGRVTNIPGKLQKQPQPICNPDRVILDIKHNMQSCPPKDKEWLIKFKEIQQEVKHNEHAFIEWNLVLLKVGTKQKLDAVWKGPCEVKKINGSNALGPTQPSIRWVPGANFSGIIRLGRYSYHSSPTSHEVKRTWISASTSPYVFMLN